MISLREPIIAFMPRTPCLEMCSTVKHTVPRGCRLRLSLNSQVLSMRSLNLPLFPHEISNLAAVDTNSL